MPGLRDLYRSLTATAARFDNRYAAPLAALAVVLLEGAARQVEARVYNASCVLPPGQSHPGGFVALPVTAPVPVAEFCICWAALAVPPLLMRLPILRCLTYVPLTALLAVTAAHLVSTTQPKPCFMAQYQLFPDDLAIGVFLSGLLAATINATLASADILIRLARLAWRTHAARRSRGVQ